MPDLPVPSYAGALRGLRLSKGRVQVRHCLAGPVEGMEKERKEIFRLAFDFDPAAQPGSEGWSFVLRFAVFPKWKWRLESRVEWTSPSGGTGRTTLPWTEDARMESVAGAALKACAGGRSAGRAWLDKTSLVLVGGIEDALFRVRTTQVDVHRMVWVDGKDAAARKEARRGAHSVVAGAIPLAAMDETSARAALAVARGLLASVPLRLRPLEGSADSDLLDGEISLLPPLPPGRKDRRGHGDAWLMKDGCTLFSSPLGVWLTERMADLGLVLRGADPTLGWRALTVPPAPLSEGSRLESRRFVVRGTLDSVAEGREIGKGLNRIGGVGLSFHEKLEILAEAEAACAALTGMRLDGSPVA